MKIVYVIAHQDDEVLTFGARILDDVAGGHNVLVVLATRGENSGARTSSTLVDRLGYTPTKEQFSAARDREFVEAVTNLGATPLVGTWAQRGSDGASTIPNTVALVKALVPGGADLVCGHAPTDPHIDHANTGHAAVALVNEGWADEARFFVAFYNKSHHPVPPQPAYVSGGVPITIDHQEPYRRVDLPDFWGVGYLSVTGLFDWQLSDRVSYWYSPPPPVPKKIIYITPHQDDEILAFGASIMTDVLDGHDVRVIIATRGEASAVRTRPALTERIGFTPTREQFSAARDREFTACVLRMGATPIVAPYEAREPDGGSDPSRMATLVRSLVPGGADLVCGMTLTDYHIDHTNTGRAALELVESGWATAARLHLSFDQLHRHPSPPNPPLLIRGLETPVTAYHLAPYVDVDLPNGMWGIGYLSTPANIDAMPDNHPYAYYHDVESDEPPPVPQVLYALLTTSGKVVRDTSRGIVLMQATGEIKGSSTVSIGGSAPNPLHYDYWVNSDEVLHSWNPITEEWEQV